MSGVQVQAENVQEARLALGGQYRPYLELTPIASPGFLQQSDYGVYPGEFNCMPTTSWRVRWNGQNGESFVREVHSLKELNAVLGNIFKNHAAMKRQLERTLAKRERDERQRKLKAALGEVHLAEGRLDAARSTLAKVRRGES